MAYIEVNDIFDELCEENKRLLNELSLANKCIEVLNEFKDIVDFVSETILRPNLDKDQLKLFNQIERKASKMLAQLKSNNTSHVSAAGGLSVTGGHVHWPDETSTISGDRKECPPTTIYPCKEKYCYKVLRTKIAYEEHCNRVHLKSPEVVSNAVKTQTADKRVTDEPESSSDGTRVDSPVAGTSQPAPPMSLTNVNGGVMSSSGSIVKVRQYSHSGQVNCLFTSCQRRFISLTEMHRHLDDEHNLVQCDICGKKFSTVEDMNKHKLKQVCLRPNYNNRFNCYKCHQQFRHMAEKVNHQIQCLADVGNVCHLLPLMVEPLQVNKELPEQELSSADGSSDQMDVQLDPNSVDNLVEENVIEMDFNDNNDIDYHNIKIEAHIEGEDTFGQSVAVALQTEPSVDRQMPDIGPQDANESVGKRWKCFHPHCKYNNDRRSRVSRHVKEVHDNERPFICPIAGCDKRFKSKTQLNLHELTHLDHKPIECTDKNCSKRFRTKLEMNRHSERIHLRLKPFKCIQCDKTFFTKRELETHLNSAQH